MNKSKFLKKSLAALLAVMLVVAMIPLSAAAAEKPAAWPNLSQLYINNSVVNVDNGVFKADIGLGATKVDVRVAETILQAGTGSDVAKLYAYLDNRVEVLDITTANTSIYFDDSDAPVGQKGWATSNDETSGGKVVIKLRMEEIKAGSTDLYTQDFTLELTRTNKKGQAVLESVSHDMGRSDDTGVYTAKLNESTHTVEVEVARNAVTPTITVKAGENGTIKYASNDPAGSVAIRLDQVTNLLTDGYKADVFYVTSEDGGNTVHWNIKVTKVDSMVSFKVGDYTAKIEDKGTPQATTGWNNTTPDEAVQAPASGTKDGAAETITVEIDPAITLDEDGNEKNTITLPVNFQANGNVTEIKVANGTDSKANLLTGDKFTFTKNSSWSTNGWKGVVTVECGKNMTNPASPVANKQYYNLDIVLKKSDDTSIVFATIDGQVASIDGQKISAVLPSKKKDGTDTSLAAVTVELYVLKNGNVAKVSLPVNTAGEFTSKIDGAEKTMTDSQGQTLVAWRACNATTGGHDHTTGCAAGTVNLSSSKTVTVTADNGETLQYEISAKIDADTTTAVLNSMTLQDKAGNSYTGSISGNTVTFTVPYMTLKVAGWKVFATCNSSAHIYVPNQYALDGADKSHFEDFISGTTVAEKLAIASAAGDGYDGFLANLTDPNKTIKGGIAVRNMNNQQLWVNYNVVIKLEAPKKGNELTNLQYSSFTGNLASTTYRKINSMINADNSFTAVIDQDKDKITYSPAYSLSKDTGKHVESYTYADPDTDLVWHMITDYQTTAGGVAFIGTNPPKDSTHVARLTPLTALSEKKNLSETFTKGSDRKLTSASSVSLLSETARISGSDIGKVYIVVLPEEEARKTMMAALAQFDGADPAQVLKISDIFSDHRGTIYTLEETPKSASTDSKMTAIKIGDTQLKVTQQDSADGKGKTITGVLPYSLTTSFTGAVDNSKNTSAVFPEYTIDKYAQWVGFNSLGDTNGDGEADNWTAKNKKLLFVRNDDAKKTVTVYTVDTSATAPAQMSNNKFTVASEDYLANTTSNSKTDYTFELTWADPCPDADILSFTVGGSRGVVNGDTINVTVPFLTDLKSQVVEFTTSPQATVTVGSSNTKLVSGKSTLNVTAAVTLTVKSEDTLRTKTYTLRVVEGEMFTDVHENDWFYDVVVEAATKGWINGRGNGIFDPYANMTRGEFATIIARIELGQDALDNYTSDSRFPDVPASHFASKGIAYCADKNYIQGVGDGNFDPDSPITREQAAIIMCKVKNLQPISGETTYADNAKIASWSKGYVQAATTAGIFEGEGADFNPQRNLRRCEGAAILVRSASK